MNTAMLQESYKVEMLYTINYGVGFATSTIEFNNEKDARDFYNIEIAFLGENRSGRYLSKIKLSRVTEEILIWDVM